MMDADQKFIAFIDKWAADRGCTFEIEDFDGHESPELIDGMAADDVWGWMLPNGINEKTDEYYGCIIWHEIAGKLTLEWKKDF